MRVNWSLDRHIAPFINGNIVFFMSKSTWFLLPHVLWVITQSFAKSIFWGPLRPVNVLRARPRSVLSAWSKSSIITLSIIGALHIGAIQDWLSPKRLSSIANGEGQIHPTKRLAHTMTSPFLAWQRNERTHTISIPRGLDLLSCRIRLA